MKKKQTKKRNRQDITLRNLRAIRKSIAALYSEISDLNRCMAINIEGLNERLVKLETKRGKR